MFSSCNNSPLILSSVLLLACLQATAQENPFSIVPSATPLVAHTSIGSASSSPTPPSSRATGPAPGGVPVKDYLASLGVDFPEGSTAVYVEASGHLLVHNTTDNLLKIDLLLQNGLKPVEEPDNIRAMRLRLSTTILPRVNFGNATVPQVIHYLEREGARVGRLSGSHDRLKITLRTPPADADAKGPAPKKTRISLHLVNVSLDETLRRVAALADLDYKVEANSAVLVPKSFTDASLVTKTYSFKFN